MRATMGPWGLEQPRSLACRQKTAAALLDSLFNSPERTAAALAKKKLSTDDATAAAVAAACCHPEEVGWCGVWCWLSMFNLASQRLVSRWFIFVNL